MNTSTDAGQRVLQRAVDHGHACLSTISRDTKHVQIERAALRTLLAFASPVTPTPATIPEGMVPWHGGDSPPADWDGGEVLWEFPSGRRVQQVPEEEDGWQHLLRGAGYANIIAYTPKAASPIPPATIPGGEREALERAAQVAELWARRWGTSGEHPTTAAGLHIAKEIRALTSTGEASDEARESRERVAAEKADRIAANKARQS